MVRRIADVNDSQPLLACDPAWCQYYSYCGLDNLTSGDSRLERKDKREGRGGGLTSCALTVREVLRSKTPCFAHSVRSLRISS
jgi:hypothetical protein